MYAVTISLRAKDAAGAEILRAASQAVVAPSLAEPGCLFFDVLFDEADPLLVRFYEAYHDREGFEAHLVTEHARRWVEVCIPVVEQRSIRNPESISAWRSGG